MSKKNGSNGSKDLGNTETKSSTKKRDTACKNWCFTLNNYTDQEKVDLYTFLTLAPENRFIYGFEKGEDKKTPHIQGYVEFAKKRRMSECKEINKRIHWERVKGTREENVAYCSKDGDYLVQGLSVKKPLKVLKDDQLYDWQKEIVEIIKKEPDDRLIYWYWEPTGNMGKTTFAKYLSIKYNAIPVDGKKNDILYVAAEYESEIYIFDFERSIEDYISYGAIEKIKNGYYMCAKYEGRPVIRNPPHIIIMANFKPDEEALSADRWVIKRIK